MPRARVRLPSLPVRSWCPKAGSRRWLCDPPSISRQDGFPGLGFEADQHLAISEQERTFYEVAVLRKKRKGVRFTQSRELVLETKGAVIHAGAVEKFAQVAAERVQRDF